MFMSQDAHIAERRQQMLGELAELDLAGAKAAHASYMEAIGTPEEAEKGRTYQRMARSLRQSLALHERMERLTAREARERAHEARRDAILDPPREPYRPRRPFPRDIEAADARPDELRTAVRRLIWTEGFEKSELESERQLEGEFYRELEDWLVESRCEDDFTTRDLDDQVAEIAETLGLDPDNVPRWRDLPPVDMDIVKSWLKDLDGYAHPPWKGSG
jgi:hypothetical protein